MQEKGLQQIALDFVSTRSERTFTVLYNRLKPGLRKFIQKYHTDSDIVDEILAITLSKAYVYVDTYDSRWNFSTWIYRICRNECLMEHRRLNALSSLDNMVDSKSPIKAVRDEDWKTTPEYEVFSNEEVIESHSLYDEILLEIKNLPEHYREIIEDRIVEKLKYKEIADKRNIKINTVRSRIHSAKKVIKNMWIDKKRKNCNKNINILGVTILQMLGDDEKPSSKTPTNEITILKVTYGSPEKFVDVTEKAQKIFSERRELKSSNRLGGDPCYGVQKVMTIEYYINGDLKTSEIKEGKLFKG